MKKTFISARGRVIQIVINTYISFQFPSESNREFYWIEKDDWQKDADYWVAHLSQKNWYSPSMTEFINNSILEPKER